MKRGRTVVALAAAGLLVAAPAAAAKTAGSVVSEAVVNHLTPSGDVSSQRIS